MSLRWWAAMTFRAYGKAVEGMVVLREDPLSLLSSCLLGQQYSVVDREWRPAWDVDNHASQAASGTYGLLFMVVHEMISFRERAWAETGGWVKIFWV